MQRDRPAPIPRGTTVYVFSITSGGRLPCGFSQRAVAGTRVCSAYAYATASSARSWACGPPAWKAITNACPLVCITALAISKLRALIRPDDLHADRGPHLRPGVPPGRHPGPGGGEQRVQVGLRVGDLQRGPVRRALGADPADRAGLVQLEPRPQVGLVRGLAGLRGALPVHPGAGRLREGGPVAPLGDRGQRLPQRVPVGVDEAGGDGARGPLDGRRGRGGRLGSILGWHSHRHSSSSAGGPRPN